MSAIGPGDWVQCVRSRTGFATVGAIYQILRLLEPHPYRGLAPCMSCGQNEATLELVGIPEDDHVYRGFCPCGFRLWPPPADEALRCEPVDQDEPVSVPA